MKPNVHAGRLERRVRRLIGRYRLFFGFCPKCNSNAPELYDCDVCNYDTSWPPTAATKARWRKKFEDQLNA